MASGTGTSLAGRTAWVIGGGSGIGAGIALALARLGASVHISGRRGPRLESVAATAAGEGAEVATRVLNVMDADACRRAAAEIGPVDLLIVSAGTNVPRRRLSELSPQDWRSVIGTNLDGAFNAVQVCLPGMRARGGGLVVVVSSWAGWRMEPVAGAAYGASKRALLALTESINIEEGVNGIRATCLCPAETDTEVLDTRPLPPSPEQRAAMLTTTDLGALVCGLALLPRSVCVNELVVSPLHNAFYQAGEGSRQ